jgi:hypothetical protein
MTTYLYGEPTHVVEWLDFPMGELPERWRIVKGPWGEGECWRYVGERQAMGGSCYPERYRVRPVGEVEA